MRTNLVTALLCAAVFVLSGCASTPLTENASVKDRVLDYYRFDGWDQIAELEFSFNVQRPNGSHFVRSWHWDVEDQTAELRPAEGEEVAINLADPGATEAMREAHGGFINDTYWLLFPYQLVWSDPLLTERGSAKAPIGDSDEALEQLDVSYPAGGYTPGDTYELYVTPEGRITAWVFVRGERRSPITWEMPVSAGPIRVSLDHHGADGFRLWFDGVRYRLRGEKTWREVASPKSSTESRSPA